MRSVFDVAKKLAEDHKKEDPETTDVFVAEATDEVRLVEVSGSLGPTAPRAVLPFRFNARPDKGVDYPSVVVLLSPSLSRCLAHPPIGKESSQSPFLTSSTAPQVANAAPAAPSR
jgi:hypothetical protein